MKSLLCLSIFLVSLPLMGQGILSPDTYDEISKAHGEYVRGDLQAMAKSLKEALMNHEGDQVAEENAIELMTKAIEVARAKGIPVDWKVPEEINQLTVKLATGMKRGRIRYHVQVQVKAPQKGIVQQIKLEKYPNNTVVDLERGIGEYEVEYETEDKVYYHELTTPGIKTKGEPGLYLIKIKLTNGKTMRGWFILDKNAPKLRCSRTYFTTVWRCANNQKASDKI